MTEEQGLAVALSQDLDVYFVDLVTRFETMIYTTALRMCGQPDRATELSAEAFHRAYRALKGYESRRIADLELRPWLVTIVLNLCRNDARSRRRAPRQVSLDEVAELTSREESPEGRFERGEDERQLIAGLAQLSERHRAAVVLRHIVGLSYEEISCALSCPDGTAKSYVSRALKELRTLIGNDTVKEER